MNRVIIRSGAVAALLVLLAGCGGSTGPRPPAAASIARALRAHGIDCTNFELSRIIIDQNDNVGTCDVGDLALDITTFRSIDRRRLFEVFHDGICPIAALRDDPVTLLPYARGERWIVSAPSEVVTPGEGNDWRALAPKVARALGGEVATIDCPALNA
jgi:hypothetical protein